MSPNINDWFAPDHEFRLLKNDYAVVNQSASSVLSETLTVNEVSCSDMQPNETFGTLLAGLKYDTCYEFSYPTRLLFADVDDTNPAHREKVYGKWAKETPLKQASEKSTAVQKALVQDLVTKWHASASFKGYETQEQHEEWVREGLQIAIDYNEGLDKHILAHLLTAKTADDKAELLTFLSGQSKHPTQRPVLVLVGMIDSEQSTEAGKTEGWVIGHDIVQNKLIIKPFVSQPGKHPLGGKWYGPVADDGVSCTGTPHDFAAAYIALSQSPSPTPQTAFRLLVHTVAAKYLRLNHTALSTPHPLPIALPDAIKAAKHVLATIPFRAQTKPAPEPPADDPAAAAATAAAVVVAIEPFRFMQNWLEMEEAVVRDAAVGAKEMGEDKVATNTARVYERIYEIVKGFNGDPKGDF